MTSEEWHTSAFRKAKPVTRAIRFLHRNGGAPYSGLVLGVINRLIAPSAAAALRRTIEPTHLEAKPWADAIAVKLMDYHLLHLSAIDRGFGTVRPVLLTRDPLAQVESLMRSGLTLEAATRWCLDVLNAMEVVRQRWSAPVFQFEALLADPVDFVHDLYGSLGLTYPQDGLFRVKLKAYGDERRGDIDAGGNYRYLKIEELRGFVDADVNDKAISRLSNAQRNFIVQRLRGASASLGYDLGASAYSSPAPAPISNVAARNGSGGLLSGQS